MGRASTRQNKTPYQLAREELGLSRERAAELLETIPAERIERIESERSLPRPDEVLRMAQRYKKPSLCNAYCARACPIGQEYVPEIKPKELPAIVLEMLATLNTLDRERRLPHRHLGRWQHRSGRAGGFPAHPAGAGADLPDRGGPAALGGKK
ncbi:MAG: helix-turn-helix domain-containing protein [Oscillospiraceae bacterium]